jgi:lysophospholipase L1-like esterase
VKALAPLLAVLAVALVPAARAGAAPRPCRATHWVGAWYAAPSDASRGTDVSDVFDSSGHLKTPARDETARVVLTPSYGGSVVQVRLSNRFGTVPVTFARTTIARRDRGAALVPGTVRALRFAGRPAITLPPGGDAVSDPVRLGFRSFQPLAVSTYVPGGVGKPSEHYTGRQTSYETLDGAGDHAADVGGGAFTSPTTTRPWVAGLAVRAPRSAGTVVAFGDSITDGYQGQAAGVPETSEGIDADGRWPDVLSRRLRAAKAPLAVVNAGISGNRVLRDGLEGGNRDTYGPSALKRLARDGLDRAGTTTVILLEGINDLGQDPQATPGQLVAGYRTVIARLHARRLRVLLGTLTPSGGASGAYGTAATNARRQAVNTWIRTKSPADGVVDFDRAVRDPSDPSRIDPRYDGSDHLHFNLAGYRAMGDAVPLARLARPRCLRTLSVRVAPRTLRAGRRTLVRVRVRMAGRPLRGATVRLAGRRAVTDRHGRARLRVRYARPGRHTLVVRARGAVTARAAIRVR